MKDLDIRIRSGGDDAIAAACELMPKWIPVSERLPEKNTLVLVHTEMDANHVASIDDGNEWFCNYGGEWLFPNVTHWMPLPEPPANYPELS